MKTKVQVLREHPDQITLINAVVDRVGLESVPDINMHGMSGGFHGFIYYADTVRFFNRHRKAIMTMAEELAEEVGEGGMIGLIQGFNCLSSYEHRRRIPDYTVDEIAKALYTGKGEYAYVIKNAMAWFTAEEVCRMFED